MKDFWAGQSIKLIEKWTSKRLSRDPPIKSPWSQGFISASLHLVMVEVIPTTHFHSYHWMAIIFPIEKIENLTGYSDHSSYLGYR